jgi:hypothetical protein
MLGYTGLETERAGLMETNVHETIRSIMENERERQRCRRERQTT